MFRLLSLSLLTVLLIAGCSVHPPEQTTPVDRTDNTSRDTRTDTVLATFTPADGPVKRALLVGVSRYLNNNYDELHTEEDIRLIREALAGHGFTDFIVLQNEDATYAGVKAAFDDLVARTGPGDVVVFHFSGHGIQITDGLHDTNPGDEFDGYDETLVLHDAPAVSYRTPLDALPAILEDVRHLRDDEIHTFLEALRQKIGPKGNVALWVDACYSGSAASNFSMRLFDGPHADSLNAIEQQRFDFSVAKATERSRGDFPVGIPAPSSSGRRDSVGSMLEAPALTAGAEAKAPLVVFSSSRPNQKSFEVKLPDGTQMGRFSLAMSTVLRNTKPGLTYKALFDQMVVHMTEVGYNQQTPQLEGQDQLIVFSAETAPYTTPHYTLAKVKSDTLVQVDGGTLLGLTAGTRMAFYPIGTTSPDTTAAPLATGTVQNATGSALANHVDVRLDAPTDPANLRQSWAFVTRYQIADLKLKAALADDLPQAAQTQIKTALEPLGFIEIVDAEPTLDLMISEQYDGLVVEATPSTRPFRKRVLLPSDRVTPAAAQGLAERILDYGRLLHLERIAQTHDNTAVAVELSIVPPAAAPPGRCTFTDDQLSARQQGSTWFLDEDDGFLLKLENKGRATVYFAVLALEPDGRITQLYPRDKETALDAVTLSAGKSAVLQECYTAGHPAGMRTLKVFASRKVPLNFEPILSRNRPDVPLTQVIARDLPPRPEQPTGEMIESQTAPPPRLIMAAPRNLDPDLNTHAVTLIVE